MDRARQARVVPTRPKPLVREQVIGGRSQPVELIVDFFASQDLARRKTKWLVFYYALAIMGTIAGIYAVAMVLVTVSARGEPVPIFNPAVLAIVTVANLVIIGFGSLYKIVELRGGGDHVAAMLGGAKVPPNTQDRELRVLVNVVEEMALAAGIPVPSIYVLDEEDGINAFAAGYSTADAVIGVNRGTLSALTREELQGVIAHEFSHIMNGDMRLNIRLIGVLFGIQLIAMLGYFILRLSPRGSSRNGKNGAGAVLVMALALLVFGSIGRFFARLIKASISRQREFLADASAVQFTRNPSGIAGALKMIGAHQRGSLVESPEAEEVSHLFFGAAVRSMFGAFATHPPLVDRVQRVEPGFDGNFRAYAESHAKQRRARTPKTGSSEETMPPTTLGGQFLPDLGQSAERFPIDPAVLIASIGTLDDQNVSYAHRLLGRVNKRLLDSAHEPFSARCIVFALLLDSGEPMRMQQVEIIANREGDPTKTETLELWRLLARMDEAFRLPLLEIVQGTLRGLSSDQYKAFRITCIELVRADGQLDMFEFYLRHHILMHLDRRFQLRAQPRTDIEDIDAISDDLELLLSAFVEIGHDEPDQAKAAYAAAISQAGIAANSTDLRPWKYRDIEASLLKLCHCAPSLKKKILQAAATAMTHDHKITIKEAEIFRAFAESIDCPVPPLVPGGVPTA